MYVIPPTPEALALLAEMPLAVYHRRAQALLVEHIEALTPCRCAQHLAALKMATDHSTARLFAVRALGEA